MSDEITIRVATPADAGELLKIYAPYVEKTAITFEYAVPSEAEFAARIRHVLEKFPYLVAESQGRILGYAYASAFHTRAAYDWAVEISIYLRMDAHRRGIGTLLYGRLEALLKRQGILNVNASIADPDAAEDEYLTHDSMRFHEKMGYTLVGRFHQCGYKFGRWYSTIWMEKMLAPHTADQPPVIPFPELQ